MSILEKVKAIRKRVDESMQVMTATETELLLDIAIRDYLEESLEDDHETADALMNTLGVSESGYVQMVEGIREAVDAAAAAAVYMGLAEGGDLPAEERKQRRLQMIAKAMSDRHSRMAWAAAELKRASQDANARLARLRADRPDLFPGGAADERLAARVETRRRQLEGAYREQREKTEAKFLGDLNTVLARQGHAPVDEVPEVALPKDSGRAGKR